MTEPKEIPALFSGEMVRSANAGLKTVTRRIVKPQPMFAASPRWQFGDGHSGIGWYCCEDEYSEEGSVFYRCPYGQPGDLLVPLTTWAVYERYNHLKPLALPDDVEVWSYWDGDTQPEFGGRLRPGRFLPKRLRLKRVEG